MQHLLLILAMIALPVSAVLAEEQDTRDDDRDEFTYEETASDEAAASDEERDTFTYDEAASEQESDSAAYEEIGVDDSQSEDPARQDTGLPQEGDQQQQSGAEADWEREGSMRTQTATVGAEPDEAEEQRVSFGDEEQGEVSVARQQFASDVQDKEPVDQLSEASTDEAPIFFFTEIDNAEGETITHRWSRDGEVMAEVQLEVGSDNWRTWSSKEMLPEWEGEWQVEVVDSQGNVLAEDSINVQGGQAQYQQAGYQEDQDMEAQQEDVGFQQDDEADWQQDQQEIGYEQDDQMQQDQQQSDFEQDDEQDWEQDTQPIDYEQDAEDDQEDDDAEQDW